MQPAKSALLAAILLALPRALPALDNDTRNHLPVKAVGDQRLAVHTDHGGGTLVLYASPAWQTQTPHPDITRAVLVFHGLQRNADSYWHSALKAEAAAGESGAHTLLIVPQFLAARDVAAFHLPASTLAWSLTGWMGGEAAEAPAPVSAFEAVDAILARLADRNQFPNLQQVVLAGHSGGAQIVQRYAVVGQGEAALSASGVKTRYVIANPSSYLYFSPDRPVPAANCPGYNGWKYGWDGAPAYARQQSSAAYEARYVARDVVYLLGTADTDPHHPVLDISCEAETQGPYRYARGQNYVAYLRARHPGLTHRVWDVPGVAHDGGKMLTSACGLRALFDDPAAAQACGQP